MKGLPPPWTVAAYEGPLRAILAAYKEHGRTALATPLGEALATAVQSALTALAPSTPGATPGHDAPSLVWVPSSRNAIRRRGHDALRGLVDVAAERLRTAGLPVTPVDALRQRVRVADQATLTAAERTANLEGALAVTSRIRVAGREVILVDDVVTTGASLTEAARALRDSGAHVLAAATIATTPRRHP
ncbi:phosphoribosyltransferase family protein [Actinomadura sp. GC306]|uniref:ComF family protein n=1 Tax=Actinomadura sp. GC306 TaxID=2530367 RepID=UPI001FB83097|nr:phosphoribosyltransferase family protein [Actinomadura sp. GC306]